MSDSISKKKLLLFMQILIDESIHTADGADEDDIAVVVTSNTVIKTARNIAEMVNNGSFDMEIIA